MRKSAATQNAILAAARAANTRDFGSSDGAERDEAQVLIQAASALARFAPFALGTVITTPATDSQFQRLPVFNSAAVTENNPFGIMLDPAAAGKLGRGILCGMAPAQVTISDAGHTFVKVNSSLALESAATGYARIIWKASTSGSQWCLLALPAAASGTAIADGTATGQILYWNNTTKAWTVSTVSSLANGDLIKWDGSKYINIAPTGANKVLGSNGSSVLAWFDTVLLTTP